LPQRRREQGVYCLIESARPAGLDPVSRDNFLDPGLRRDDELFGCGIYFTLVLPDLIRYPEITSWIPAFAGMTIVAFLKNPVRSAPR
jgi:hypothetical protein